MNSPSSYRGTRANHLTAILNGHKNRYARVPVVRALFAAQRAAQAAAMPTTERAARVALQSYAVRDMVWLAVDGGQLGGGGRMGAAAVGMQGIQVPIVTELHTSVVHISNTPVPARKLARDTGPGALVSVTPHWCCQAPSRS